MKKLLLMTLLAFSFSANAAYVYNYGDNFFTNDVTGQEWLRLENTLNMSVNTALSTYDGYRSANEAEMVDLLSTFFGTTVATGTSTTTRQADSLYSATINFTNITGGQSGGYQYGHWARSLGLWENDGNAEIAGVYRSRNGSDYYANVQGTGVPNAISLDYSGGGTGVWLVKDDVSPVPLPPAVWLFGMGLVGLIAAARRGNKL